MSASPKTALLITSRIFQGRFRRLTWSSARRFKLSSLGSWHLVSQTSHWQLKSCLKERSQNMPRSTFKERVQLNVHEQRHSERRCQSWPVDTALGTWWGFNSVILHTLNEISILGLNKRHEVEWHQSLIHSIFSPQSNPESYCVATGKKAELCCIVYMVAFVRL